MLLHKAMDALDTIPRTGATEEYAGPPNKKLLLFRHTSESLDLDFDGSTLSMGFLLSNATIAKAGICTFRKMMHIIPRDTRVPCRLLSQEVSLSNGNHGRYITFAASTAEEVSEIMRNVCQHIEKIRIPLIDTAVATLADIGTPDTSLTKYNDVEFMFSSSTTHESIRFEYKGGVLTIKGDLNTSTVRLSDMDFHRNEMWLYGDTSVTFAPVPPRVPSRVPDIVRTYSFQTSNTNEVAGILKILAKGFGKFRGAAPFE